MTLDALCEAAIAAKLDEICVTDHTDFGHPDPMGSKPPVISAWLADIERARRKYEALVIRAGIEIGDNPLCREQIKAFHAEIPLDFRLLSLHLIDNADPYFADFFPGREQDQVYMRYVESLVETVLAWEPSAYDALAHVGYCAKFAPYPVPVRPLRYRHAPDAFDTLFRVLAEQGKALEINVSGRKTMGECLPDRELLSRFRALGGEFVTVGSDAHTPEYVGLWLDDARTLARECGFQYALTFDQKRAIPIPL